MFNYFYLSQNITSVSDFDRSPASVLWIDKRQRWEHSASKAKEQNGFSKYFLKQIMPQREKDKKNRKVKPDVDL